MTIDPMRLFFSRLIYETDESVGFGFDPLVIEYVASVLTQFVKTDALLNDQEGLPTLALWYSKAINSMGQDRRHAFRRMGDVSLFMSGFFIDRVRVTGGLEYFMDMGCLGYDQAMSSKNDHVMLRLSRDFPVMVDILNRISNGSGLCDVLSVSEAYDIFSGMPDRVSHMRRFILNGMIPSTSLARG